MRTIGTLFFLVNMVMSSCTPPMVKTSLNTTVPSSDKYQDIKVYKIDDKIPVNATILGTVKVGDTGFSTNCGFFTVLDKAIEQAKLSGGNAIKIIRHIPPGHSTCHRITALILKITDSKETGFENDDTKLANYAILNIFADPNITHPFSYSIFLSDTLFCRIKNDSKIVKAIYNAGIHSFSIKSDTTTSLDIEIKLGEVYYLKCGSINSDSINRPTIQLVDKASGSIHFNMFTNPK